MLKRGIDIKLNVKPVFIGLVHQYYYEGPCRFAAGDALTPEYDEIFAHQMEEEFLENIKKHMPEEVNLLEPAILYAHDDWILPNEAIEAMTSEKESPIDAYFVSSGIARAGILVELAERTKKPIIEDPYICCDLTLVSAALKARGLESYTALTWEGVATIMKVLRVRKALKEANILLAVRFNSNVSKSADDTFVSLDMATKKFGTHFRFVNIHELLDYLKPLPEGGNYTTPGRMNTPNMTPEDEKEAEALADDLLTGADDTTIDREYVIRSCRAYVIVKKLLELNSCSGFSIPCPDLCSTRRINQEKVVFCMVHALLNEQGIASACEYDVDGALSMLILSTLSGCAPFLGNTSPLVYENGAIRHADGFNPEELETLDDVSNLYYSQHSSINRKMHGIDCEAKHYGLRYFAHDQKFGACFRCKYTEDRGKELTICRISPDCKKLFVGKGELLGSGDYDTNNCGGFVYYRVADQEKFFKAQLEFGNHLPMVYGDYTKELTMLGEILGLEVMNV